MTAITSGHAVSGDRAQAARNLLATAQVIEDQMTDDDPAT
jgi:hypothetical protein